MNSGIFSTGTFSTGTNPAQGGVFRSRPLAVLAVAAVVALLWAGKVLFVTLFFALFLSFAIAPFVELLGKIKVPRVVAILIVLLMIFALVFFFVANALEQTSAFARDWPTYETKIRGLTERAQGLFAEIEAKTKRLLPEGDRSVRAVTLQEGAFDSLSRVVLRLRTILSLLLYAAAVPMLSFFMLKDRDKYAGAVTRILRRLGGRAAADFAEGVARVLSGYVLGELFV